MTALLATTALGFSSMPATCETAAKEPPIPGKMPGTTKPSILLAQDVDWPPYAYLAMPPEGDYTVAGFGKDVAMGLSEVRTTAEALNPPACSVSACCIAALLGSSTEK